MPQLCAQVTPQSTLTVQSQLVVLDVAITDTAGRPVTDLRPDEFRITERGVPQRMVSFEAPEAHALPAALAGKIIVQSTADLSKLGSAPVTLLMLDELNMNFPDRAYARTKLLQWLSRQAPVLDQPTALLSINDVDCHSLHDFTQSRDDLISTLKAHTGDVDWRSLSNGRTGELASENMAATLGAIERVAQATRGYPGRKNLIWVGDGFPSVTMGDIGRTSADQIASQLSHLTTLMLEARVVLSVVGPTLKPMDEEIVETQGDQDIANVSGYVGVTLTRNSLEFGGLAAATGGRAYSNRNDLDGEIGESVSAGSHFYTLAYRPTDTSNDPKTYRRIRVTVTRPSLHVTTRDGYFKEPEQTELPARIPPQQLAFDLFGAVTSALSYTDLHLTVEHVSAQHYLLHATAQNLTWRELPDGRRHADVIILAASLSPRGRILSRTFATLGSNTEASIQSIGISTAALPIDVPTVFGASRIRFVVRDMVSGRVGTVDVKP